MKTKVLLISSRIITDVELIKKLESFYEKFELVHLFLPNGISTFPTDIKGIVFNSDTDSTEIGRIQKILPSNILKVRIYSAFEGFDEIPGVRVRHTHIESSDLLVNEILN